jgi:type IV pilus biogenesis protein CpaD/CtpE
MKLALAVVALALLSGAAQAQSSPLAPPALSSPPKTNNAVTLKVGDKAPDFALPNGDGKLVSLSDYTSVRPVVIVFYRGFW